MAVTRRQFVSRSGLLAAASASFPALALAKPARTAGPGRLPRRIIHLVSDGMSLGTLTAADYYSLRTRGRPSTWTRLYRQEGTVSAFVNMRSLNSIVTDSAAASSSWGSGSRVKNGTLNILPDGRQLRPLATLFADASWARGLVTTTEITHATPAGFAANAEDRGTAPLIAAQYLERRMEVLLGGGRQYFEPKQRKDKRDLKAEFRAQGYAVCETRAEFMRAPLNQPWLGIFASGHLPYTVDHLNNPTLVAQVPTLAEMTRRALDRLSGYGRFLLQVEGGRVDHAAHSSDAGAMLPDQIAFDEALDACLEFQRHEPDTLIVVTTDHGNSNPGLNGMGGDYEQSPKLLANVARYRQSFSAMFSAFEKAAGKSGIGEKLLSDGKSKRQTLHVAPTTLAELIALGTGFSIPAHKTEAFARYLAGEMEPLYDQLNTPSAQLGQLLAHYTGIGFTGTAHTADFVPLLAVGPGAERFRGFLENTDVFPTYLGLAGIKFHNPEVPLLAESAPAATDVEDKVWA